MNFRTADEWEHYVGDQLKSARLRQNLRQEELASRAGISVATLARLESGKGSTLQSFIRVLKVLRLDDWFEHLVPEVSISPLQIRQQGKMRQRARKPRVKPTSRAQDTEESDGLAKL